MNAGHRYKRFILIDVPGKEESVKVFEPEVEHTVGDSIDTEYGPGTVFFVGWQCGVCGDAGYEVPA